MLAILQHIRFEGTLEKCGLGIQKPWPLIKDNAFRPKTMHQL